MIRFLKIVEKHNLCFKQSKYDFNIEKIPILEIIDKYGWNKTRSRQLKNEK